MCKCLHKRVQERKVSKMKNSTISPLQSLGAGHPRQYPPNPAMVMKSIISMNSPNGMVSRNQLTTINQSQINGQLSLNMGGPITHTSPSPPASKSATPSPSSSINEDEQEEGSRVSKV